MRESPLALCSLHFFLFCNLKGTLTQLPLRVDIEGFPSGTNSLRKPRFRLYTLSFRDVRLVIGFSRTVILSRISAGEFHNIRKMFHSHDAHEV